MLVAKLPQNPASHSTAIFVGPCERGPLAATKITSRSDYTAKFGGYLRGSLASPNTSTPDLSSTLAYAMDAFFANGGASAYVLRAISNPGSAATATRLVSAFGSGTFNLDASSPGAWANNYVQTVDAPPFGLNTYSFGVYAVILPATSNTVWPAADPTGTSHFRIVVLYALPNAFNNDGANQTGLTKVEDWDGLTSSTAATVLAGSNYIRWNGSAGVPVAWDVASNGDGNGPPTDFDIFAAATVLTGLSGGAGDDNAITVSGHTVTAAQPSDYGFSLLNGISDAGILVVPSLGEWVADAGDRHSDALMTAAITYVNGRSDLVLLAVPMRHTGADTVLVAAQGVASEMGGISLGTRTSVYWPWVEVTDPAPGGTTIWIDPAALVAGLYSQTAANAPLAGTYQTLVGDPVPEYAIDGADHKTINTLKTAGVGALIVRQALAFDPRVLSRGVNVFELATGG